MFRNGNEVCKIMILISKILVEFGLKLKMFMSPPCELRLISDWFWYICEGVYVGYWKINRHVSKVDFVITSIGDIVNLVNSSEL